MSRLAVADIVLKMFQPSAGWREEGWERQGESGEMGREEGEGGSGEAGRARGRRDTPAGNLMHISEVGFPISTYRHVFVRKIVCEFSASRDLRTSNLKHA
jgi:hypothetical protein